MTIRNAITNILLPLVVLEVISYNSWFLIMERGSSAGTFTEIGARCGASMPYTLAYTGLPLLDSALCGLVVFFHTLLDPVNLPLNVELMTSIAVFATIPYLEAARPNRNNFLQFQWVIALACQMFTSAVILPVYWLLFIVTGAATLHYAPEASENSKIDRKHAESILFALLVGYVVPTVNMFGFTNPYVTISWKVFPLWMYIAQRLFLSVRPASHASGSSIVKFIFELLFLMAAIPHIYLVTPHFYSPETLEKLFVPSFTLLHPSSNTLNEGVLDVIKWDLVMTLLGTFATTFWVAERSLRGIFGLVAWWAVSSVLFGPAASVVGVFWWREGLLEKARKLAETEKKYALEKDNLELVSSDR